MVSGITTNDLKSLKQYLETTDTTVADNATAVEYTYNVSPQIYRQDLDGSIRQVNPGFLPCPRWASAPRPLPTTSCPP